MLTFYQLLTRLASPLIALYLRLRLRRGKEDRLRIGERFGHAGVPRPEGKLIWLHAASVGEAVSLLPLIERLQSFSSPTPPLSPPLAGGAGGSGGGLGRGLNKAVSPNNAPLPTSPLSGEKYRILLTTGTVTSAALLKNRLPEGVTHQFVPVDTPQAAKRFMRHWRPDLAVFVESELWPNLILGAKNAGAKLALINARMSEKSYRGWLRFYPLIAPMLESFSVILAQNTRIAERFRELGAKEVEVAGNLKHDALALTCRPEALAEMRTAIGIRPFWVAASIHPGEDEIIAHAHRTLATKFPNLLTIIAPRHPERAAGMAEACAAVSTRVARRSAGEAMTADTAFYLADTMGELGLWYTLSGITFIGGSLIPHGGQNPLEAARLETALIFGQYMDNFAEIRTAMLASDAAIEVRDAATLAGTVARLLDNPERARELTANAKRWVDSQCGVTETLAGRLVQLMETP